MNTFLKKDSIVSSVILLLYIIFFSSLFFSFRAISSVSIGTLLIAGILKHNGRIKDILWRNRASLLLTGCAIFFLLQFILLLYTSHTHEGWKDIRLKSGLVIIPLAVILSNPFEDKMRKKLMLGYCLSLLAAGLYCLFRTFLDYMDTGNISIFFYHQLVKPLHQHAVYFSIFVFTGLIFLLGNMKKKYFIASNFFTLSLILFFSVFLFLLSSKLIISFYVLYVIGYFISLAKNDILNKSTVIGLLTLMVILVSTVFLTSNPISERFRDIMNGDLALVTQDKYSPGDYFNGVQFRLLQWKLVPEILNRHKSWWKGVGSADAQAFLDQEYVSKNMYLGDPSTGEKGYRGYNTHNQFLEALLKNGIPGLLAFLFICFTLIRIAWQKKQREAGFIIVLLLLYAGIESVFETQYGIVLFTFFPSFLCQED